MRKTTAGLIVSKFTIQGQINEAFWGIRQSRGLLYVYRGLKEKCSHLPSSKNLESKNNW